MKKYILFLIAVSLLTACQKEEFDLSSSIFVEDTLNPGLPQYSEWGYNTFGAYLDREPFISSSQEVPIKVVISNDSCHIHFNGRYQSKPYSITFSLPGFLPTEYTQLTELNKKKYLLKNDNSAVTLTTETKTERLEIIDGELDFRNVQNLYVDKELTKVIMSGNFLLKVYLSGSPSTFSNGRFDLGVGYDNFYNLQK